MSADAGRFAPGLQKGTGALRQLLRGIIQALLPERARPRGLSCGIDLSLFFLNSVFKSVGEAGEFQRRACMDQGPRGRARSGRRGSQLTRRGLLQWTLRGNYSSSFCRPCTSSWAVTPNERWRPDKLKHVGHWNNFLESRSQEGWQSGTYAQLQYSSLATPPLDLLLDHIAGCQV